MSRKLKNYGCSRKSQGAANAAPTNNDNTMDLEFIKKTMQGGFQNYCDNEDVDSDETDKDFIRKSISSNLDFSHSMEQSEQMEQSDTMDLEFIRKTKQGGFQDYCDNQDTDSDETDEEIISNADLDFQNFSNSVEQAEQVEQSNVEDEDFGSDDFEALPPQQQWETSVHDMQQAIEEGWFDSEDEVLNPTSDRLEDIKDKMIFAALTSAKNLSEENIMSILDDTTYNKKAAQILNNSKQAVSEAVPFLYGRQVIEDNEFCYLETSGTNNTLHIFNGKYWQKLEDDALKQLVYDSIPDSMKIATKAIERLITQIANYVKREMKKAYNDGKKRFSPEDYNDIENHIVFQNGVLDVLTGEILPFSSKKPYYYAINCEYINEDVDTPYYDKFKADSTGGDEASMNMFDLMQAYLLIPNRKGKCFFIMSYAKDSGKTTFGEFIERYFEEGWVHRLDTEHLGGKFSYAGFDQALLVSCLEMPIAKLSASATKALKNFTGESKIEVEAKYQNHTTAAVRFKTLLASNGGLYLPHGESDEAFYRRVVVIPFIHSTPLEQIKADMPQKWEEERSAIISKCVRKLRRIMNSDGGLIFPESLLSQRIKNTWVGKSLLNEDFVKNVLEYTASQDDKISKSDLMTVYNKYYAEHTLGMGTDRPIQCSKDELVRLVLRIYPNVRVKKTRSVIYKGQKINLGYCIFAVKWSDHFLQFAQQALEKNTDDKNGY